MKLYYAEVLNPRKVCAVAKHVAAPVEYVRVALERGEHRTDAFRARNPNARVPVLEDGAATLWEADAIICHLCWRTGSDLWPRDERQVEVLRWLGWNQAHFNRCAGQLYFENIIKPTYRGSTPDPAIVEAATREFMTWGRILDDHLDDRPWLVGEALTTADFAVSAALPYAREAKLPLDTFPAILRWRDRLAALPAWSDPYPPRQLLPAAEGDAAGAGRGLAFAKTSP